MDILFEFSNFEPFNNKLPEFNNFLDEHILNLFEKEILELNIDTIRYCYMLSLNKTINYIKLHKEDILIESDYEEYEEELNDPIEELKEFVTDKSCPQIIKESIDLFHMEFQFSDVKDSYDFFNEFILYNLKNMDLNNKENLRMTFESFIKLPLKKEVLEYLIRNIDLNILDEKDQDKDNVLLYLLNIFYFRPSKMENIDELIEYVIDNIDNIDYYNENGNISNEFGEGYDALTLYTLSMKYSRRLVIKIIDKMKSTNNSVFNKLNCFDKLDKVKDIDICKKIIDKINGKNKNICYEYALTLYRGIEYKEFYRYIHHKINSQK